MRYTYTISHTTTHIRTKVIDTKVYLYTYILIRGIIVYYIIINLRFVIHILYTSCLGSDERNRTYDDFEGFLSVRSYLHSYVVRRYEGIF